jgi:broad specificity polyphosphatase/5'/3'-nucleotidase SurE
MLASAQQKLANVQVVAPGCNRSVSSDALELKLPLSTLILANSDIAMQQGTLTHYVFLGVNSLMQSTTDICSFRYKCWSQPRR